MTDSGSVHIPTNDPILFLFVAEQYSTIYMYHVFFSHSFVEGHSGYFFYFLAVVNSAAMNTGVHMLSELWFSQSVCPAVELLQGEMN